MVVGVENSLGTFARLESVYNSNYLFKFYELIKDYGSKSAIFFNAFSSISIRLKKN